MGDDLTARVSQLCGGELWLGSAPSGGADGDGESDSGEFVMDLTLEVLFAVATRLRACPGWIQRTVRERLRTDRGNIEFFFYWIIRAEMRRQARD